MRLTDPNYKDAGDSDYIGDDDVNTNVPSTSVNLIINRNATLVARLGSLNRWCSNA